MVAGHLLVGALGAVAPVAPLGAAGPPPLAAGGGGGGRGGRGGAGRSAARMYFLFVYIKVRIETGRFISRPPHLFVFKTFRTMWNFMYERFRVRSPHSR